MAQENRSSAGKIETLEDFRTQADRITTDVRQRARDYLDQMSPEAKRYYSDIKNWMGRNQNKVLIAVGSLAVIGLVGYFVARQRSQSEEFFTD